MADIKQIISKNIASLRHKSGLTQLELAEKLNYSDKAISKWERGESIPDIVVLKAIADLFEVTVDQLISEQDPNAIEKEVDADQQKQNQAKKHRMHNAVTAMSVVLCWVIAVLVFIVLYTSSISGSAAYLTFVYAVVASLIVWLVFNSIWHNRRRNYLIVSLLMWSVLVSAHLSVLAGGYNLWLIYLLGIPGQLIISLWAAMGRKK
ncbi:MAG: helix-turn-helix transcriptional regulator [Clostridia bacterium]|nr:helix-turn-helix transcriptional regulator [Clostridia bacterium]